MAAAKWITDEQILAAFDEHKDRGEAAKSLDISYDLYRKRLKKLNSTMPVEREGFSITRTTTLEDQDGNARLEWVRRDKDKAEQETAYRAFVDALKEEITPAKPIEVPARKPEHLLNQYTITDFHLGMMAWKEESGTNWNLKKAEDLLVKWFQTAINCSPDSHTAVFAQLGDFLHWDGLEAVTPQHKHVLDADTRFQKLIRVAIAVIRRVIELLLMKHNHVHIIHCTGNHDQATAGIFREMLAVLYEKEPRISVDTSPDVYYSYRHGKVSLFYHHGHKRNPANVSEVFAGKFRELYGNTEFSYAHLGHKHSSVIKEDNLMLVEQHPTLAAADAYSSHGGWLSKRAAKVITYHKQYGKVGELVLTPEMVEKLT
jgi:hypothetical protein